MAGKIIADIIEAPAGRISLNVANVTVASINASGLYTSTGNLLITQANSIATAAIENGAVTSAKIAPSAIVGTVSQSGGVPTGAIIERGSNANGEFVRYADGTMICSNRALGVATNTDVTLPSAFVNGQYVVNPTHRDESDVILATQDVSRTTTNFRTRVQNSSASFVSIARFDYTAIGRWF